MGVAGAGSGGREEGRAAVEGGAVEVGSSAGVASHFPRPQVSTLSGEEEAGPLHGMGHSSANGTCHCHCRIYLSVMKTLKSESDKEAQAAILPVREQL